MLKTFFFEFWDSINILLDVCWESLHNWLSNFSIWLIKKKERKLFFKRKLFSNISIGFQTFYLVNQMKGNFLIKIIYFERATNFLPNLHLTFDWHLWPSQNIWTLKKPFFKCIIFLVPLFHQRSLCYHRPWNRQLFCCWMWWKVSRLYL